MLFKKSLIVLSVFTCVLFSKTNAQTTGATATSQVSATIVTPITINKTVDMSFGNVSVNGNAGTVVLSPSGSRTKTGGVNLPVTTGTVAAASFTIGGQGDYTYAITLPSSADLTHTNSTDKMTVNAFTSTPSGTGALNSGSATLVVGATLNVSSSQLAGTYSGNFPVTVDYN